MTKSKYKIIQDWYYTDNGCDCCDPDKFEIYYIEKDSVLLGDKDCYGFHPYSFSSVEQTYEFIFHQENIEVGVEYKEED